MTTYYIRTSGNDLFTGLSGSGAWLTIGKANSTLQAGDTVYIGAGDYSSESVNPTYGTGGSLGNLIVYYGDKLGIYTSDIGIIQAKDFDINKQYISIRGIDFEDPCSFGSLGTHPDGVIVDACSMPSLTINYPDDTYIENCIIGPSSASVVPLDIAQSNLDIYIYYNTIIGPSSFTNGDQAATKGVLSIKTDGQVYAKNNIVVANCDMKLIWLYTYAAKNHINYNRFHSSSFGTYFAGWEDSGWNYRLESTFDNWKTDSGQDSSSSVGDPDFTPESYRRYHIYATSPCVGVAIDVGIDHDYDYDARSSDIGADEVTINTRQRTITSDTNITGTMQKLIVSNANIVIENVQQIIISDASILERGWQFILSNAQIKIIDIQNILISDASVYNIKQQLITSDAKIIPGSSPDSFSFVRIPKVVSNFSLKTQDETKLVLYDVKLEHICDHNLPSGKFTLNTCPRCLGKGFYYDIKFSPLGDVLTVSEVEKLLQELVKITITSKGDNPFYADYGSYVVNSLGALQTEGFRETKLKQSIMDAVLRLRYLQRDGIERGYKFSLKELIDKIESIEIYEIEGDPRQLGFKVKITNVEGSMAILQGAISL